MNKGWKALTWGGFAVTLAAALSYLFFFLRFPVTRDVPWVNYLLFLAGFVLLAAGVKRAFAAPGGRARKITAVVLSALSALVLGVFCYFNFSLAKNLPLSSAAPRVGQQAPDFTLTDAQGNPVTLSQRLQAKRGVLLVFYRGYW